MIAQIAIYTHGEEMGSAQPGPRTRGSVNCFLLRRIHTSGRASGGARVPVWSAGERALDQEAEISLDVTKSFHANYTGTCKCIYRERACVCYCL